MLDFTRRAVWAVSLAALTCAPTPEFRLLRYAIEMTGDRSGVLVQTGDLYRNPVELELKLAGGKTHVLSVLPTSLSEAWTADVPSKIESVTLDPHARILFARER